MSIRSLITFQLNFSQRFWWCFFGTLAAGLMVGGAALSAPFFQKNVPFTDTATHVVELTEEGFVPKEIVIRQNDIVVFKTKQAKPFWPASDLHPEHTLYASFDPQEPIAPDNQWSFQFTSVGIWKYHDHIEANNTGTIIVTASDGTMPKKRAMTLDLEECARYSVIDHKRQCWDDQLELAMQLGGVGLAFEQFSKLYETEPDIPKDCHGWGHTLGKAGAIQPLTDVSAP